MNYYSVFYEPRTELDFKIIKRTEENGPFIGKFLITDVKRGGKSALQGVQNGDYILSINSHYVAFSDINEVHNNINSKISKNMSLCIYFIRIDPTTWLKLQENADLYIKEGSVNRLSSGLFKKWIKKDLKLSTKHLSFYENNLLKEKASVETDINSPQLAMGHSHNQGVFCIDFLNRSYSISTGSSHACNLWMHAIDSCINKAFDKPLNNFQLLFPLDSQASNRSSRSLENSNNAYLQLGRSKLVNSTKHLVRRSTNGNIFGDSAQRLVSLVKVKVTSKPLIEIDFDEIIDPSLISISYVEYNFELEQKVLNY